MKPNELLELVRHLTDEERDMVLAILSRRDEGRKVVEVAGKPVVTAARDPKPEKR